MTVALAALVVGGCGGSGNSADFGEQATQACADARQAAEALPEQTSDLVAHAALQVKELPAPASGRAAASTLVATMERQGRATAQLADELRASAPDPARVARLRDAVERQRRSIESAAAPLDVRGCGAIPGFLLQRVGEAATVTPRAAKPSSLSPIAYRRALRKTVDPLTRRTQAVQAAAANRSLTPGALEQYAQEIARAADRVSRLRAPADIADVNTSLVRGLRGLSTTAATAAQEARAGRTAQALQVIQRFATSRSARAFGRTVATLRDQDYLP